MMDKLALIEKALDHMRKYDLSFADNDLSRKAIEYLHELKAEQAEQAQPVAKSCGHECGCSSICARDDTPQPVAWVDAVMHKAQIYAESWKQLDRHASDTLGLRCSESAKAALRAMLTAPPQRKPLTDQERSDRAGMRYYKNNACTASSAFAHDCICWAPEAARNITGENT